MKRKFFFWACIAGFALLLSGCEVVTECDDQSFEVQSTLSDIQDKVFDIRCATSGCHAGTVQANLNLSGGQAYANLVNVDSAQKPSLKLVAPGNSAESYLIHKLRGQDIEGGMMPLTGDPLSEAEIQAIETWIDNGAMNN